MPKRFSVPGRDEVAARTPIDAVPVIGPLLPHLPDLTGTIAGRLPWKIPVKIPVRLPPWLFRDIAYFSYAIPDTGPGGAVDGVTTGQEDIFRVSAWSGLVRRVTDDRSSPVFKSDRDPAWSPSRNRLAIHTASDGDADSHLAVIDAVTGVVVTSLGPGRSPEWLDGSTLLFLGSVDAGTDAARSDVFCVDTTSGDVTRLTDVGAGANIGTISWHPAAGLAMGVQQTSPTERSSIAVVPAGAVGAVRAGGAPVPGATFTHLTPAGMRASTPGWSPTGDRIAISTWTDGSPPRVGVLTVATGAVTPVPGPTPATLSDFGAVFSRDGRVLAFTRGDEDQWGEIWLYTIASGHLRQLTDDGQTRFKGGLDW
jgi:TolB protein